MDPTKTQTVSCTQQRSRLGEKPLASIMGANTKARRWQNAFVPVACQSPWPCNLLMPQYLALVLSGSKNCILFLDIGLSENHCGHLFIKSMTGPALMKCLGLTKHVRALICMCMQEHGHENIHTCMWCTYTRTQTHTCMCI